MNYFRNKNFKKLKQVQPSLEDRYGVPQHSGLMTAIGIAVIMEGFSSASYHVCPNNVNYQFDTALMYVIGMLGKLKIWSMRHPDMVVEAYHAFGFLGLILLAAIAGVYVHGMVLWIVISIIYIASILLISFEFYYKGIWSLNFRELRNSIRYSWASSRRLSCVVPAYKTRFFVILLLNISNIAVVVYGLYDRPKDFLSFLLFPFIGNLFMYIMYYIVMKIFHCESIPSRATVLLIAAFGLWFVASWFFTHHVSDWSKTPAISRELNKPCVFLDFYDNHDLWHLLSAFAIFASFTALNIIDDDLIFNSRNTIRVF
uniref:Uncharacterized protein n=1 Tax=Caenorhabditis japonica TaxID=281687 RepID=A0A8R1HSC5_CAEJA